MIAARLVLVLAVGYADASGVASPPPRRGGLRPVYLR